MVELLMFIFSAVGLSHILVDGSIFNGFKAWLAADKSENLLMNWFTNLGMIRWGRAKLLALMNCYQCSGFWAGVAVGLILWCLDLDPLHATSCIVLFCYGCAASFLSTFAAVTQLWIQSKVTP